ncbi:hypothetical protein [Treponema succinifaciens]|uniref:hypothetical protein n=1 Tax=Treponema succinifaciens TaxID=167 RepID=UPI0023F1E20B|nr:hypothetical protein [Treponema succinifaciens]
MKKLIFSILPAFLFAFISCMNMSSGSGENGSVRVALPGSGRATYTYSKNNADKFIVRLYNDDFDQTEEGAVGGVIEFGDLEPGKYTATAEAWNLGKNILEGSGSTEITVRAGETTDCNITMILEGQTAYYSKYMILTDYSNIKKLYNYTTMQEISIDFTLGEQPYNPVEDREGKIYYIRDDILYRNDEQLSQIDTSSLIKNPLYYDSKTDSLWLASFESNLAGNFVNFSVFENPSAATSNTNPYKISYEDSFSSITSCQAFAVKEDNIYIAYNNSNILLTKKNNPSNTEASITLSSITPALSGEVTDMAVLEDGTVAVLVNDKSLNTANQFTLNDGCTVYSRGALVLLSSDLSTYKVYGWTDSPRTISATGSSSDYDVQWDKITAYIPEYAERNSHFYGPMRIVVIRPKELVIADCGANFVLPDYIGKKNGKMFTHNRLMTVNLRNFAIGCKKEFSESELKFQYLTISGNLESVTAGWTNLSAENEK